MLMQVLLNGGKKHVFQSAMRATARLNLLSPAVFPLPFGSKFLPLPLSHAKGAQRQQGEALAEKAPVKGTAGTTASMTAAVDQAKHEQHAQHVQQASVNKEEAPDAALQIAQTAQSGRHAKHAKYGESLPDLPDHPPTDHGGNGPSQSMPFSQGGESAPRQENFRAGSKSQRTAAGAVKACNSTVVVGPVAKLVGSSSGLAPKDELEAQSQSPGM